MYSVTFFRWYTIDNPELLYVIDMKFNLKYVLRFTRSSEYITEKLWFLEFYLIEKK